jgi:hypothetical protein
MPIDPSQDKDFRAASPADQHAYLMSQDKDYASAAPADQQAYLSHVTGRATATQAAQPIGRGVLPPEQRHAMDSAGSASMYGLTELGKGVGDVAKGFGQMLDPRTQGAGEATASRIAGPGGLAAYRAGKGIYDLGKQALQVPGAIKDLTESPDPTFALSMAAPRTAGQGVGQAATVLGPKAFGAAKEGLQTWAKGDPNAPISEALHVPVKSPKMQAAVTDVEAARPYLKGAQSQADVQAKLPGAKAEVWEPYQKAVDLIKDRKVAGPDGPTTVGDLEAERLKLSAEQQAMRKIRPTDQQSALQAQNSAAELKARYADVTGALDKELRTTGIDPEAIRRVHGNLKGVERNVSGKSTVTEPMKPYGGPDKTSLG